MTTAANGLVYQVRAAQSGAAPHPMLLMLHGRGADEFDLLGLADVLDPRLLVVSVRAPLQLGPGFQWYVMEGIGAPEPVSLERSVGLLRELFAELRQSLPIDQDQIYGLGFSQGAMMTAMLRLAEPTAFAGSVLLSGYLPASVTLGSDQPLKDAAFFIGHGVYDEILPVWLGRQMRETLAGAGATVTYHEYPMEHQIMMPEMSDLNAWLRAHLR